MIEAPYAVAVGVLFAASLYLMMSRSLVRIILGVALISNAVNLLILLMGRLTPDRAAFVPPGLEAPVAPVANALPQALILTAIVISFSLFAFVLILAYRAFAELRTVDTKAMHAAEPEIAGPPLLDRMQPGDGSVAP